MEDPGISRFPRLTVVTWVSPSMVLLLASVSLRVARERYWRVSRMNISIILPHLGKGTQPSTKHQTSTNTYWFDLVSSYGVLKRVEVTCSELHDAQQCLILFHGVHFGIHQGSDTQVLASISNLNITILHKSANNEG